MKAINIKWDTDGDADLLESLPSEIEIPEEIAKNNDDDEISDYITNQTGFCHFGFDII